MDRFDRTDDRLTEFTQALWNALVPQDGECISVQGELVRAILRLESEHYRNGMMNYYAPDTPAHGLADGYYPKLLLFVTETLAANRNGANADASVAYFADVRKRAESDWSIQMRIHEIAEREEDENRKLSDAENEEIA